MMDAEKLIDMSKSLSRQYLILCVVITSVLSVLLGVSMSFNAYQATQKSEVVIEQDYDYSDNNMNQVK